MNLPKKLVHGDQFKPRTVEAVNEIIDYLRAITLSGGNGVAISQGAGGIVLSVKPQKNTPSAPDASVKCVIAKITSGDAVSGYAATIYPDYPDTANSRTGTVYLPEMSFGADIPANTYVVAVPGLARTVEVPGMFTRNPFPVLIPSANSSGYTAGEVWSGAIGDQNYFLFLYGDTWCLAQTLTPRIRIGSDVTLECLPGAAVNGYPVWASGTKCLMFSSVQNGWIYQEISLGFEPGDNDAWYHVSFPAALTDGAAVTLTPDGSIAAASAPAASILWPKYIRLDSADDEAPAGTYQLEGGSAVYHVGQLEQDGSRVIGSAVKNILCAQVMTWR